METSASWLGSGKALAALRPLLQQAQGLQCNGPDTFNAYARYNPNPLKFYDSRITDEACSVLPSSKPHTLKNL
ncbi:MAG: hypothetical protein V9E81_03415 [Marmoricola sp.]